MYVTIELPEDISAALEGQWDNVPQRSLEAIAVEAYRTGAQGSGLQPTMRFCRLVSNSAFLASRCSSSCFIGP